MTQFDELTLRCEVQEDYRLYRGLVQGCDLTYVASHVLPKYDLVGTSFSIRRRHMTLPLSAGLLLSRKSSIGISMKIVSTLTLMLPRMPRVSQ